MVKFKQQRLPASLFFQCIHIHEVQQIVIVAGTVLSVAGTKFGMFHRHYSMAFVLVYGIAHEAEGKSLSFIRQHLHLSDSFIYIHGTKITTHIHSKKDKKDRLPSRVDGENVKP